MRVGISGTRNGADWPPLGGVLDVDDDEGAQLCAGGLAEPVYDPDEGVRTAVAPPPEVRSELAPPAEPPERRGPGRPRKVQP
jgi:hypothetical protein